MYEVSKEYTELMDDETSVLDVYVQCSFADGAVFVDGDVIEYIELSERVNDNSNILTLGNACSHSIRMALREPPPLQYKGLKCEPKTGLRLPDGSIEWVPLGKFWVDTAKTDNDYKTVIITAYDKMYQLNGPYSTSLTYPALIADVVAEFENLTGIKIVKPEVFPELYIQRKVEDGKYTYRDIAGHLAGCLGCNATFNRDGDMEFVYYTQTAVKAVEDLQYMRGFEKLSDHSLKVDFIITGTEDEKIELENDGTDPGALDWRMFDSANPDDYPWLIFAYDDTALTASVSINPDYAADTLPIKIPYSLFYNDKTYVVTAIPSEGFKNCKATEIVLPDKLKTIGTNAFIGCTGLTTLTIPSTVTNLGNGLTSGCSNLETLNYNAISAANDTTTASSIFSGDKLKTVLIGEGVEKIPTALMRGASSVTFVSIPNTVKTIQSHAFRNTAITTLTIPESVTSLGWSIVNGCDSLKTLYYNAINATNSTSSDSIFTCDTLTTAVVGLSVQSIPSYAFRNCVALKEINIPGSVTSIGVGAFNDCAKLQSVYIPGSVKTISDSVFSGCTALSSVTFGEGVTNIGESTFRKCAALTNLQLPNSVKKLEAWAFAYCTGLLTVQIGNSSDCAISSISSYAFRNDTAIANITIYKSAGSVSGSPWGAENATVQWLG